VISEFEMVIWWELSLLSVVMQALHFSD
jgi:hypothetical protein